MHARATMVTPHAQDPNWASAEHIPKRSTCIICSRQDSPWCSSALTLRAEPRPVLGEHVYWLGPNWAWWHFLWTACPLWVDWTQGWNIPTYIYIYILANWPVVLFPRSNFFLRTQSINRAGGSPRPNRSHCSGRDPPTTRIRSRSIGKLIELIRTSDPTTRLVFELDKCQKRPIPRIFNWGRDVYCIEMEV